jgi:hypothetical protein
MCWRGIENVMGEEDTTDGVLNDADRIFFAIVLLILLFFAGLSYLSLAN